MDREGRKISAIVAILVAVWVLLLAFRIIIPFNETIEFDRYPSSLRIGLLGVVDSLNPYVGRGDESQFFYSLIYDCLTTIDEDLKPTGNLAVSWWKVPLSDPYMIASGDPYGSVWEYNLSRNTVWHDGVPFTADDVVYSLDLVAQRGLFETIPVYDPYRPFISDAEKIDNYTVRIHFRDILMQEPMPVSWGDSIPIHILPKHLLEQVPGGRSVLFMNWTGCFSEEVSPGKPIVGTGPWIASSTVLKEWTKGTNITVFRNPIYHWKIDKPGNPEIKINQLDLTFYQDSTSMVLALKGGYLDCASYPPTAYQAIKDEVESGTLKNVTCFDGPKVNQYWTEIAFCMNEAGPNPSRLDPVIRQALHMATNKTNIVNNMYLGYAEEGTTLIPPVNSFWHYEPTVNEKFNYNPTAAANLLEANGYTDTDADGIREATNLSTAVQMGWVNESEELEYRMLVRKECPEERDIAQYLKTEWRNVGVGINYTIVEELTLSQIAYSYAYDTLIWYWSADMDPIDSLHSHTRYAWSGWSDNKYYNPAYDENYSKSLTALDFAERKICVDGAQRVFYNDSAYIVMAYLDQTYAWRDGNFGGWGDWGAHPGRSLDAYWGAAPLFFDLHPNHLIHQESEPSTLSMGLNVLIVAAIVGTGVETYFIWKRSSSTGRPPRKE